LEGTYDSRVLEKKAAELLNQHGASFPEIYDGLISRLERDDYTIKPEIMTPEKTGRILKHYSEVKEKGIIFECGEI